jgi:hypothetical protein
VEPSIRQKIDVLGEKRLLPVPEAGFKALELSKGNNATAKARLAELVMIPDAKQLKVNL